MALERSFAREVEFRALEPSVIQHISRMASDNPGISSEDRYNALNAILDEHYPIGYREWFYERLNMVMG